MIPFTRYMRPSGRKVIVEIRLPPHLEKTARALINAGFRFESETLRTGHLVMYVLDMNRDEDEREVAIEMLSELEQEQGGNVIDAIEKLINSAAHSRETAQADSHAG